MITALVALLIAHNAVVQDALDTPASAAEAWARHGGARFCEGLEPGKSTVAILRDSVPRTNRDWRSSSNKPLSVELSALLNQRLSDQLSAAQADNSPAPVRKNWSGFEGCTLLFVSKPMKAGEFAFVVVEREPGGTGGSATLLALKRGVSGWQVVANELLWVS